ncbi:hypothetical protein J4Q44_G00340870 [Coregonus suidteri]|uniref:Uncharacterized protein n=1 Tax=Coregonus suidteri TaxID=861788 RepID=A0AAN8QCP3_9TELE
MNTHDWMALLLILVLIGGGLAAPLKNSGRGEETANMELISNPHLIVLFYPICNSVLLLFLKITLLCFILARSQL